MARKSDTPMLILSALLFALTAFLAPTAAMAAPRTVRIGTFKLVHMMAPLFHERHLPPSTKVEVIYFNSSQDIEKAVVNGNIDFGQYGVTAALIAGAQNDPQVLIGDAARKGVGIVVKADSPIKTVADLRGKRIGNFPGSIQDVLLRLKLKEAGLDPNKDVTIIKVNFSEMAMALRRGDLDAFSGAEPHPTLAVSQGFGRILTNPYDTAAGDLNSVLATSKALIAKDPALVQAVVCAHKDASNYMLAHQADWLQMGRKLFAFDTESTKASLANVGVGWELSDAWTKNFKAMGKAVLDLKMITREPNYHTMLDASFSQKAARGACK